MIHKIDLNSNLTTVELSIYDNSRRLLTYIVSVKNKYSIDNTMIFNKMIIPMGIFNFLSDSSNFHTSFDTNSDGEYDSVFKVGCILDMDVYVDLTMQRNHIKLTSDLESVRDSKIDELLDNGLSKFIEAIIEVDSEYI